MKDEPKCRAGMIPKEAEPGGRAGEEAQGGKSGDCAHAGRRCKRRDRLSAGKT
jgi:hypothetical protein